jgi:ribosomal protein L24
MLEEKRWCILRHADSDLIGEIFSGKRKVYNASKGDVHPLPPFEYFIPFADMKQKPAEKSSSSEDDYKPYDAMLDDRALRTDLHHFIFICASKEQVLSILDAPWVKVLKNRLYAYHDENGVPFEISNTEMERFKTILKRFDFQIIKGEPSGDVQEGDEVLIIGGPMAGSDGRVKEIRERDGQILLTIELSMFQNKMRIAVPGISISDVRLKEQNAQRLLQDPIISQFENELIELLCHLHGKKGSHALNKDDQKQLRFLYQYSDIVFEDNEENRKKFAALMLICVYLMNDREEIARRSKEVEDLLMSDVRCKMEDVGSKMSEADKQQCSMFKAAIEREESQACLDYPEREQSRGEASMFNVQCSMNNGEASMFNVQCSMVNDELSCYLVTALFIVKHEASLRQQAKAWCKSHPDCPLVIRRFLSIAKQIRC